MNWVEPKIILDRSQNAVMVVSSHALLWLDHGTQKYRVDSFRFAISLRLVKSNGLKKASDWLRVFLTTWLHFSDTTWVPKDQQMKRTLVIVGNQLEARFIGKY
jgi:hypothetical protein